MGTPSSSASFCSSISHNRTREPLLPPPSAEISRLRGVRIARAAHRLPPAADGVDRKARGVVVDADADPAGVLADVVDPIGHGAAKRRDQEVVHAHRLGLATRAPFATAVLEIAA